MAADDSARSVRWVKSHVVLIDQKLLPATLEHVHCNSVDEVADHIRRMTVRGAPAIGAAGGFAMAMAALATKQKSVDGLIAELEAAKQLLDSARPTAVNLSWATAILLKVARQLPAKGVTSVEEVQRAVETTAITLAEDDVRINKTLSEHGATLVKKGWNMLHHCNTGRLATVDYGTALGIIYECHEQKKDIHVWVDETRPRLQGARLTAWELMQAGVDMHLIADSASGLLMRTGKVDVVVFGADRVAANGDVANKIGTYNLSVVAHENNIPVYCAVPTPTIDLAILNGNDIPIEERSADEVASVMGQVDIAPKGCKVFNPAFDITPAKYITAIVTEEGICYPPFDKSLAAAKRKAEERVKALWEKRLQELGSK